MHPFIKFQHFSLIKGKEEMSTNFNVENRGCP